MSSIKAPNFRDVIPACCYNCQEGKGMHASAYCKKYGHAIEDLGLKICDDIVLEDYK